MSVDGSVELTFGGDSRLFRLSVDNLIALQGKRDSGPLEIAGRLQAGTWRIEDITETIRIALIGGGMDGKAARELVEAHVKPPHITAHVLLALAVLLSALQGDPDDPVGKKVRRRMSRKANASPPPPTTEAVQ